jgi:acetyl/propionyl-CoA carboxylase alpha subunit
MDADRMVIEIEPAASLRAWGQVAAAIELVAQGHYPGVTVSGIPNARRIAAAFRPDAERCGVEIILEPARDGGSRGIIVRRR